MKLPLFLLSVFLILPGSSAKKCGFFDKTKERISCVLMVINNYSGSLECDYSDQWEVVKNF
ncbi:hypothetical protein CAEBREN_23464 [Caenorhabditis brenneri]|uniref:Uncharacterized protein n=1 Tax=Caenorhabditis brenneri TaxID=135651 RepID=G0M9Z1_CAEBE|nr:hypothetical protein CAEBREN_23464 [Caenorhabditis brenneri]